MPTIRTRAALSHGNSRRKLATAPSQIRIPFSRERRSFLRKGRDAAASAVTGNLASTTGGTPPVEEIARVAIAIASGADDFAHLSELCIAFDKKGLPDKVKNFISNQAIGPLGNEAFEWLYGISGSLSCLERRQATFTDILGNESWRRAAREIAITREIDCDGHKRKPFGLDVIENVRKAQVLLEHLLGPGLSIKEMGDTINAHLKRNIGLAVSYGESLPTLEARAIAHKQIEERMRRVFDPGSSEMRAYWKRHPSYEGIIYEINERQRREMDRDEGVMQEREVEPYEKGRTESTTQKLKNNSFDRQNLIPWQSVLWNMRLWIVKPSL